MRILARPHITSTYKGGVTGLFSEDKSEYKSLGSLLPTEASKSEETVKKKSKKSKTSTKPEYTKIIPNSKITVRKSHMGTVKSKKKKSKKVEKEEKEETEKTKSEYVNYIKKKDRVDNGEYVNYKKKNKD